MGVFKDLQQLVKPDNGRSDEHSAKAAVSTATAEKLRNLHEELGSINRKFDDISGKLEEIDTRFNDMDSKVSELSGKNAEQNQKIDIYLEKFDETADRTTEFIDKVDGQLEKGGETAIEKLDKSLANFPKLEENIVRRTGTSVKETLDGMQKQIDDLKASERKTGAFTKGMLTISLILNILLTAGVVTLLLYHMDMLAL